MTAPLDGTIFGENHCFGCAVDHPIGFRLRFTREGDDTVTRFMPTERYQGPPGIMHGGLVMTLADEIGAWTIITQLERFGFTAEMNSKLHQPVRIGTELEGRGRITRPGSRVVGVEAEIRQGGEKKVTASMRFVLLDKKGAEKMLGRALPDSWAKFAR